MNFSFSSELQRFNRIWSRQCSLPYWEYRHTRCQGCGGKLNMTWFSHINPHQHDISFSPYQAWSDFSFFAHLVQILVKQLSTFFRMWPAQLHKYVISLFSLLSLEWIICLEGYTIRSKKNATFSTSIFSDQYLSKHTLLYIKLNTIG